MTVWNSSTYKSGLDVDTEIVCRAVQLINKFSLSGMIMLLFNA